MQLLNKMTKTFEGLEKPVLNNIELTLQRGHITILMGVNGAGKSTLLKAILEENKDKKIACVVQDINQGTIPELTLLENMVLSQRRPYSGSRFYHQDKPSIIKQLASIKTLNISLDKYIDEPLKLLSGGQRQMIATVMALSSQPDLVLLDEPLSALDTHQQALWVSYTLDYIRRYNIAALLVIHDLEQALTLGERLLVLFQGQFIVDVSGLDKSRLTLPQLLKALRGDLL